MSHESRQRREFLRALLAGGVGSASLLGALGTLTRAQAATTLANDRASTRAGAAARSVAGTGKDGFRALVCVFLYGGNDAFNTLVPTDESYDLYARARGDLAVPRGELRPVPGAPFGLHPALPEIEALGAEGRVAWGLNVGPLLEPTSRADFRSGRVALPPQLFSHEHQQQHWQTADPGTLVSEGWLGRAADLLESTYPGQDLPFNISLLGSNTLQVGPRSVGYAVGPEGPNPVAMLADGGGPAAVQRKILAQAYRHPLMAEHTAIRRRSIETQARYAGAFEALPALGTVFPETPLARQLLGVARFLAVRGTVGIQRQAFFVGLGGFDTHAAQARSHPALLAQLDGAVRAFHDATVELGLDQQVSLVTLSEFGRTLTINGDGTDHGWGSHQLVVGGAVRGGVYGKAPSLAVEGPDDAGEGRLIPSLSLEQFLTPLLRWYGVPDSELDLVLPNRGRFDLTDLGYLA